MKFIPGHKYLGDYLVEAGVVTPEQLEEALQLQREKGGKKGFLGRTLTELGYCKEEDIARIMARRFGVPYVTLESQQMDGAAASLISPEDARRYKAMPISVENGRLRVAMMNPRDIIAIDDLRILTGHDIQPVVVMDSELEAAIERFGRTSADIEQVPVDEEIAADVDEVADKPAVIMANMIINQAVQARASDVHIEPQERSLRIRFRIDGVLHDIINTSRQMHLSLVSRIKIMANMDIAERRIPQDGRISLKVEGKSIDLRVASLPLAYGEKLTLRLLDSSNRLLTLEEIGFPPGEMDKYKKIMRLPNGFILVTGPTGCGKSTTLYATLAALNSVEKHIITVEDPIEYRLEGLNQMQVNPKAGLTFANGLRSILRNDPDIIMIGEIRDLETAHIAVQSALTGHLVLSTLHTNEAAGAVTRLGDMGIEPFLIASSLAGVVAQRLVRLLCVHCKEPYELERQKLGKILDIPLDEDADTIRLYRPRGCMRCSKTGYRGRIGIYELLLVSETIQRLILEGHSTREIKDAAVADGMVTMRQDGMMKVKQGITSLEEVLRVIV